MMELSETEKGRKMVAGCPSFELKATLDPKGVPIRHVYREIMSVCYGFFSPLRAQWLETSSKEF